MDGRPEGEDVPGEGLPAEDSPGEGLAGEEGEGEESVFRRVPDGYDPEQVDREVRRLRRALAVARGRVAVEQASARGLQARMDWLTGQARKAGEPSYSGLGARIEQLLRMAGQQADDVIAAARQDAEAALAWAETGLPEAEREQVLRQLRKQVRAQIEAELQARREAAGRRGWRGWLGLR